MASTAATSTSRTSSSGSLLTPRATCTELWRRVAFTVLVSNFDDHLRNHGFLRTSSAGWTLSPAFDLNPDPRPGPRRLLSTAIDFDDNAARLDTLLEVADAFRLSRTGRGADAARGVSRDQQMAHRGAGDRDPVSTEIEEMAPAFEHAEAEAARAL